MVKISGSWLSDKQEVSVVISSRARLARNLKDLAFPGWAGEDERAMVCETLHTVAQGVPMLKGAAFVDMGKIDQTDKDILRERHLISNELSDKGVGSAVITTADERVAMMINEEDHIRLQALCPGLDLLGVWKLVDEVDSAIDKKVHYAFDANLGYLTACPSNLGTGLRLSVMLHLPGLRLMDELEQVMKGLARIDMEVRGLFGEGTEAFGNMFQVSNRTTLGESEDQILKRMIDVVNDMILHEMNARGRLLEQRSLRLLDHIGRAFGILMHARMLTSIEAVDLMSAMRLGVEMRLVSGLSVSAINEILLLTQPGHLQKVTGISLGPQDRDRRRADLLREKMGGIRLT